MSKYLSPKLIIAEAWELTKEHKKTLFWYGFIPAFFGMIVESGYILYQFVATRHAVLGERDTTNYGQLVKTAWNFLWADGTPTILFFVLAIIVAIGYFFIPVFCRGSLVFLIEKIKKGEHPEKGMQAGIFRFQSVFEYTAIKNFASPFSFFTEGLFVFRNSPGILPLVVPVLIIFAIFGLIVQFFFAYVPQILVLQPSESTSLTAAISKSAKLTMHFFSETLRLFLLLLLIELRVFINIAIVFAIPLSVAAITGVFATTFFAGFGIFVAILVTLILLSIAATLSGVLEIFSTAMWTLAFHALTPNEEKQTHLD